LKANHILGGRENSNVSPTHRKLYNYTTEAKSLMVMSTAVNNFIRNDPYVKIIYTKIYIYEDKANPLQAWTGPEGSWRLRLSDFKTFGT
jgi:hypothetical protein